ncbi:MAG: RNA polymerase sigma factor [Planctomycetia bacterium]|nr:RNA polymerase sigma factor [Planctomycetia bacterium]
MPVRSDHELIEAILQGDSAIFEEIVRRYESSLYYFLLRRHSPEDANDLLQETFLEAWKSLKNYNLQWKFSTWLFAISYHTSAGFFRKKKRDVMVRAHRDGKILDQVAVQEEGYFVELSETKDIMENVWETAHEVLPESQVMALWLFYVEEKSIREISHIMQRSEVGVKILLFRGRKKLRRYF